MNKSENIKIYKYCSIKDKYTIQNIENGVIHFSNPTKFNDPFDSFAGISFEMMVEKLAISEFLRKKHGFLNDEINVMNYILSFENDIKKIKKDAVESIKQKVFKGNNLLSISITEMNDCLMDFFGYNKYNSIMDMNVEKNVFEEKELKLLFEDIKNQMIKKIRNEAAKYRISSFSSDFDNVLMWSHYADKHNGVCIEYEINKKYARKLFKVKYTKTRLSINDVEDFDDDKKFKLIILKSLKQKSLEWKYEKEWRFIFKKSDLDKNDNFTQPKITKIYFGAALEVNDFIEIKKKIESIDASVDCIKLKLNENKYLLEEDNEIK